MSKKGNTIIEAIKQALDEKFEGKEFQKHLINSNNRTHKTIEAFQKCLAAKLSFNPKNGCEYKLYQDIWEGVNDRADIRGKINLYGKDYELIIEIDATRADQVAKKMMSRFCYSILKTNNLPIVYVALLYQGTKSMNSDECKKYFKMGDEVLRKINPSNVLIGYIVDKNENVCYVSQECNNLFNDYKAFDSDLYRRYLEDHGVHSPASIECYMLPLNMIHKCPSKAKSFQKKLIEKCNCTNYRDDDEIKNITGGKGKNTYWQKYCSYLKEKWNELDQQEGNEENNK